MDDIKKIVASVVGSSPTAKREKSNHTLSLNSKNFITLRDHCSKHKKTVSEVVDMLIAVYLEQALVMGELTPSDLKGPGKPE